ncbi:hypothetical protein B9G98_01146 [Wickerhamiella sorbophila]|uniref:Major facilitator superfamily (MFS) profile domain-containing protein n=1 Tax=Wickerhamiella sorbophila TaxID=45607 RepID=A0A2T0FEV1_9ASCO|nr:hypothetical protein B9G98_01146 [Wickerhamiella sorbophila]PRT53526.1 hypothetical protein B9G98_01146 [Wickerhamiella sorbophila]
MHRVAYLLLCGLTIALLVFLNSTQSFLLSDKYKIIGTGSIAGTLAFADEIMNIMAAPLWGALSDKIGTRYVSVAGMAIMGIAVIFYPREDTIYPGLLFMRLVFALGASACVSMVAAILGEYSQLTGPLPELDQAPMLISDDQYSPEQRSNGKMAGLVGLCSGLGAIFAVAVFLPLPTKFNYDEHPVSALKSAFLIVGLFALAAAVVFFFTLYQNKAKGISVWLLGKQVSIFDEAAFDVSPQVIPYFELIKSGFAVAKDDTKLKYAYMGSAVARAATVITALFIPQLVNDWFRKSELCKPDEGCREAYILAAILTGVANTTALLFAPIFGWAVDRYGHYIALRISCIVGVIAMILMSLVQSPKSTTATAAAALLGIAQIGVITISMSMCTDRRRDIAGSVAGVYSLCGGVGILIVTQVGGQLAGVWDKIPFVAGSLLYGGLLAALTNRR